ncbi:hypothetical protein [Flavobacterium sp. AG291]|uniref:hypothetical protein n=1 Tax=Flavobacterium sp. AG291 TaxID=2184000 RepID=UPI000E0C5CA9|nr:hypothetical protein [Flavobacterium sp. AG291]RDI07047.1 hypothetical protein DEU42_113147 [Flavobacterium sp. AG291]
MQKSGFASIQINSDTTQFLDGITSLSISNYGATALTVTVNDVARVVPAFNPAIGVPFGSFNIPGDGTACEINLELKFEGGSGKAILDFRKIKKC